MTKTGSGGAEKQTSVSPCLELVKLDRVCQVHRPDV